MCSGPQYAVMLLCAALRYPAVGFHGLAIRFRAAPVHGLRKASSFLCPPRKSTPEAGAEIPPTGLWKVPFSPPSAHTCIQEPKRISHSDRYLSLK